MDLIKKTFASIKKRGIFSFLILCFLDFITWIKKRLDYFRDWNSTISIHGSPGKNKNLIVVLAGYKEPLWPITLSRIKKFEPLETDICIVSAGKTHEKIMSLCKKNNWCYISTTKNKTGLALNKAIAAHPNAEWIYKLDEDIFISEDFFSSLKSGFERTIAEGNYIPGFCSPILNVNGVSYRYFLEKLDLLTDYESVFHEKLISCGNIHAHKNPEAAIWLWKKSLPLDQIAKVFSTSSETAIPVPVRFSIGAILFERHFWATIGGFKSAWADGVLGVDEENLCKDCINHSRPMMLIPNVFAGHFSFGPQEFGMLNILPELHTLDHHTFPKVVI